MKKSNLIKIAACAFVSTFAFGLAGCKDDNTSSAPAAKPVVLAFALETVGLEQGDIYTPEVLNAEGAYTLASSDTSVIEISDGKLLAKKAGTATVTVTEGNKSDTLTVTVNSDYIPVLSLAVESPTVYIGGDYRLPMQITYKGEVATENVAFTYTLGENAEDVISLATDGTVTGLAEGKATVNVTANYRYFALAATCEVNVIEHSSVVLNAGAFSLVTKALEEGEKESAELYAIVTDNGTVVNDASALTWTIEKNGIVAFDDGVLTAVGAGTTKIRAEYQTTSGKDLYSECEVTVVKPLVETDGKSVYYRNKQKLDLPEINNLATGEGLLAESDVTGVYSSLGTHSSTGLVIADSTLRSSLWNGEEVEWIVATAKVDYKITVEVHTALIETADELINAYKFVYFDTANKQYLADIKLGANIQMGGVDWKADYELAPTQGFNGVFDGCNYAIIGLDVGSGESLVGQMGSKGVIKNLKLQNCTVSTNGRTALISRLTYGGYYQNLDITAKHNYAGKSDIEAAGILFGHLYSYEQHNYGDLYLQDVRLTATDDTVATHVYSSAFGCTTNTGATWDNTAATGEENNSKIHLKNVEVNGFANVFLYNGVTLKTADDLTSRFDCDNVTVTSKTYKDVIGEMTVSLPAQEIELDETKEYTVTVDFAALVSGEIEYVSIDGGTIDGTSKTFGKADTSNVAKTCLIAMKNGGYYAINITVWSMLIDSETELLQATDYTYDVLYDANSSGAKNYKVFGYFKLTKDLDMASYPWTADNMIAKSVSTTYKTGGFLGVFDGNGKTIKNFEIKSGGTGLIEYTGETAVIKNLTFTSAKLTGVLTSCGIVVYYACGGTLDNVKVEVASIPQGQAYNNTASVLLGNIYHYGATVKLINVTVINAGLEGYGSGTYDFATALGRIPYTCTGMLSLDGVTIVGFGTYILNYYNDGFVGKDSVLSKDKMTTNTEKGLADYATITGNGVKVYTKSEYANLTA